MVLNKLREYIEPIDLEIHIYKDGVYLVNYILVSGFSDNKIEINCSNKKVSIIGNKLVISKLKKDELYISGDIYEIKLI